MGGSCIRSAVGDICQPMQPMVSRLLAPKSIRHMGSEGLDGEHVGTLYGPGIVDASFRLVYRKLAGLATPIGLRLRT